MAEHPVHEGGCQCGAVRYRASGAPHIALACHCSACKRRTGAAFGVGVYYEDGQIEFRGGALRSFEFRSDETGRWIRNEFCERCGSAITWTLEKFPGVRAIAGGSFDDPNWFDIERHIWTRSARKDACFAEDMQLFEQAAPPAS